MTESRDHEARAEEIARSLMAPAPGLLRSLAANEHVGLHCSKPFTLRAAGELFERRLINKLRPAADGIVIKQEDLTPLGLAVANHLKGKTDD